MLRSKLTAKAQTTVPTGVRHALGLHPGDSLGYLIEGNRAIVVKLDQEDDQDPALAPFLDFLERDIRRHPARLRAIPKSLVKRARALVRGVRGDPDDPIVGPVDL